MRVATCAVPLSLLFVSSTSLAQPTEPTGAASEHAELGRQAVDHFSRGDYRQALDLFERVYAASPSPELRFNIATTYERLGQPKTALEIVDELLATSDLGDEIRARAAELRDRVTPLIGTIEVLDGSLEVVIGGSPCDVPCRRSVDPGTHAVTMRQGERAHVATVQVPPGESVRVEMPAAAEPSPRPAPPVVGGNANADEEPFFPTWATWTGVGLTAAGAAALIGFGLRAQALESDFQTMPSLDTADEAGRMVLLANIGIAVAATGLALVVFDLLLEAL